MTFWKWLKVAGYLWLALSMFIFGIAGVSIGAALLNEPNTFIFVIGLGMMLLSVAGCIYAGSKTLIRAYEMFQSTT